MLHMLTADAGLPGVDFYMQFIVWIVLGLLFYFMLIRPQRKRDKQEKQMRNSIEVGDEISTIGGMIGRVVNVQDDFIVFESSNDRTKIKLYKWAIRGKEVPVKVESKKTEGKEK